MREKVENVDAYIADFPPEVREKLIEMRTAIKNAEPMAAETISYAIPAYKFNGPLVYFAGDAKHIGLYPGAGAIETFADELVDYKISKGTVQFPLDRPLPLDLVTKIVGYRVKQNLEKTKK